MVANLIADGSDLDQLGLRHPGPDGWFQCDQRRIGRFDDVFPDMRVRIEPDRTVRINLMPVREHSNTNDVIHGAFFFALVDFALFIAPGVLGIERVFGGSTIEANAQFLSPGRLGVPLTVLAEPLKVTKRLVFTRGLIEQDGTRILSFAGTIRRRS